MTTCDVKGVACSDEPKENYRRTLQFPSALWLIFQLIVLAAVFIEKLNPLPAQHQTTDKQGGLIFFFLRVGGDQKQDIKAVNICFTILIPLQRNANVAQCLLDVHI